ncbi:MAG: hypothetical protein H0W46_07615 [Acidimicrobiia bacterium]|nr:hypothetical protein [Acidimicrobiia bacterium]
MLGHVNGIGTPHLAFTLALYAVVVGAIFILDHPGSCRRPRAATSRWTRCTPIRRRYDGRSSSAA